METWTLLGARNSMWCTNSKCGISYGTIINLNYLICLLFITYSSANLKFVTRFAVHAYLITYLTNAEGFV